MKKLTFISLSALLFFTGCTAASSLTDNQKRSVGLVGGYIQGCYQKGLLSPDDYKMASRAYSEIINDSQKHMSIISEGYEHAIRDTDSYNYNLCQAQLPNTLSDIYQYYARNRVTVTDVLAGLNQVSESYQNHANQMLQATSNNMYYPQPDFSNNSRKQTITANRIGNSTYFSDGSSSMQIGNQAIHSDGSSSTVIGNSAYHSDGSSSMRIGDNIHNSNGSNCYVSGRTLMCK